MRKHGLMNGKNGTIHSRLSPLNHEIDDNGGGGGDDVDGGIGIVAIGVMVVVRALYLTVWLLEALCLWHKAFSQTLGGFLSGSWSATLFRSWLITAWLVCWLLNAFCVSGQDTKTSPCRAWYSRFLEPIYRQFATLVQYSQHKYLCELFTCSLKLLYPIILL